MHDDVFQRHQRVAFQFSGGKDSTAALLLMRPWWSRMTVYWLDSGDTFPETKAVIHRVLALAGLQVVRIPGRVHEMIERFGPPSDLVPFTASEAAHALAVAQSPRIQDRALCCARSKFVPMHERMLADGITLIVRGQKEADEFKGPHKSGEVEGGIELLYPIEDWSDAQVMAFLADEFPDALDLYEHLNKSGDCMRCTAWLGDSRITYLQEHHPAAFQDVVHRLRQIEAACDKPTRLLRQALEECGPVPAQGD